MSFPRKVTLCYSWDYATLCVKRHFSNVIKVANCNLNFIFLTLNNLLHKWESISSPCPPLTPRLLYFPLPFLAQELTVLKGRFTKRLTIKIGSLLLKYAFILIFKP